MAKICNETLSSKLLDDLTYTYNSNGASNQLYCVTDFGLDRPDFPDFQRNTSTAQAYWYDDNGNLRQDNIKGIADIDYNYLNLPIRIKRTGSNTGSLMNFYTASGQKIRKKLFLNTNYTSEIPKEQMDYAGRAIYKGRVLRYIQTGEGRIVYNSSTRTYSWQYDIKDHLGNTRAVVAQTKEGQPTVLQQTHYYPFGLEMPGMGVGSTREEQPYLYNGKESINDLDLGWYDYGARMYDPALGRWSVVDPLCEWTFRQSPYNYVGNNPIRFLDPDGRFRRRFGAWLHKITHGGGEVLQDKTTNQYFVSKTVSKTSGGELTVTATREFGKHGNNAKAVRAGSGNWGSSAGMVSGGIPLTTSGSGVDPVTTTAENGDRPVNFDVVLAAISNRGVNTKITPSWLNLASAISKTGGVVQSIKEISDKETNNQNKTDNGGKPLEKFDRFAGSDSIYTTWEPTNQSSNVSYTKWLSKKDTSGLKNAKFHFGNKQ